MQGYPTSESVQVIRAKIQTHIYTHKYTPWQPHCNLLPLFISSTAVEGRRQTGRQTGRQAGRQTDRQAGRQAGRQTDRQVCTWLKQEVFDQTAHAQRRHVVLAVVSLLQSFNQTVERLQDAWRQQLRVETNTHTHTHTHTHTQWGFIMYMGVKTPSEAQQLVWGEKVKRFFWKDPNWSRKAELWVFGRKLVRFSLCFGRSGESSQEQQTVFKCFSVSEQVRRTCGVSERTQTWPRRTELRDQQSETGGQEGDWWTSCHLQTDRQADRQGDRQADRQGDRQADRQTDRQLFLF